MDTVSFIKCDDYNEKRVYDAINKCINLLGGINNFIKPGMKVLLKCNLLMRKKPEEAVTTHPSVVAAVARLIIEAGATPIIGDSPGGLYTKSMLSSIYKQCGMMDIANKYNLILNYDTDIAAVKHPDGKIIKSLTVIKVLEEVDAVISLCKLKTHGMTLFTGAVKNLFGLIPGVTKAEYHLRMKRIEDFSNMLIDVCTYSKPVLSIMDAVIGMEGHGPSAGTPRKIGAIMASHSPYALDLVATDLIGIPPEKVHTIKLAYERGLSTNSVKYINIVGDSSDDLRITDYKIPKTGEVNFFRRWLPRNSKYADKINYLIGPKPVFIYKSCIGCNDCERNCPPKAITMVNNKPIVKLDECIRCFCCQELCPQKAVKINRNILFRKIK